MSSKDISVTREEDGQVRVVKGTWSDVIPEERRLSWADWYDQMHQDYSYEGYKDMARLLRALPSVS